MKTIAVLTSGGDCPGMNAAIRAVVRRGVDRGLQVFGIHRGYQGLLAGNMEPMDARAVGTIIRRGGTMLQTARCPEFATPEGVRRGLDNLRRAGIDGLVVIGGDGSLRGALDLSRNGFPVTGIPATIDNDVNGTESGVGVDTAMNTALDALDKIKDTAFSHGRVFIVQVMGRRCGYLALITAITGGAELALIPEIPSSLEEVLATVRYDYAVGKQHCVIVAAEGAAHDPESIAGYLRQNAQRIGFAEVEVRVTILGHIQRGGSPTAADRLLGSRLGFAAVDYLCDGNAGHMAGIQEGRVVPVPLAVVATERCQLDLNLYQIAQVLAR